MLLENSDKKSNIISILCNLKENRTNTLKVVEIRQLLSLLLHLSQANPISIEVLTQPDLQLFDSEDAQTTEILIPKLDKELEISNSECKTTTPYEKTEEKQRVFCF